MKKHKTIQAHDVKILLDGKPLVGFPDGVVFISPPCQMFAKPRGYVASVKAPTAARPNRTIREKGETKLEAMLALSITLKKRGIKLHHDAVRVCPIDG